jgi:3-phosphoshikimate 1-carboxyvinyltransferase
VLVGLDHLRHKESDRLSVMVDNLGRLGAVFERLPEGIRVVRGIQRRDDGPLPVTAADDHRIAMSMAVAALVAGPLELDDDRCVDKSYPDFWQMWQRLVDRGAPVR